MKHKNFTTRAELLRAAADSIEMQEKAGIEPVMKNSHGVPYEISICNYFLDQTLKHEFPLAVVEGKPVWEGGTK